ncbi:hypothetical protein [uncultured Sneathia sp.]|uniref:hypothetical protein n=1 Tax=uncultured Sneathia sp. TaxID=278067 RepID=UPI00259AA5AD|nr:hypothetical protein [uncultured Sneathia sp.]
MTYEFFKKEVKKIGLQYGIFDTTIIVGNGSKSVYFVSGKERYNICVRNEFYKLDESLQKKVFRLVSGLARTSLDNRGDLYKETRWY